jgi:regulator of sirC expression with transglutaminase-like and TPR domain
MDKTELEALLTLLEDPDDEVFTAVSQSLMQHGEKVIPQLESAWEKSLNETIQSKLENIIHEIQYTSVKNQLERWVRAGADDILEGTYYVSKLQYPDLQYESILNGIEKIKNDVWLEINNNLTALEKVRILNHILFEEHKFHPNTTNFYSPQNSYINVVLESKKGNPISLSIIYMVVAQRLGVPVYGVNLPKNFLMAYVDDWFNELTSENVLFYINAFNKGAVLGKREIDYFVKQQNMTADDSFYRPCDNTEIIKRLILNLIISYQKIGVKEKITQLQEVLKIFI